MPVHTKKFLLNCVIVVAELSSQTHTSHTETIQKNEDKNIASGRGIENNELLNSTLLISYSLFRQPVALTLVFSTTSFGRSRNKRK
jgi:hypothetical protein